MSTITHEGTCGMGSRASWSPQPTPASAAHGTAYWRQTYLPMPAGCRPPATTQYVLPTLAISQCHHQRQCQFRPCRQLRSLANGPVNRPTVRPCHQFFDLRAGKPLDSVIFPASLHMPLRSTVACTNGRGTLSYFTEYH
jgi:hypothetical protein